MERVWAEWDGRGGVLVFFGIAVLTRWMLIVLLVSVGALLAAAGAGARYIWRQRRGPSDVAELGAVEADESDAERDVRKGDE